MLVVGSLRLVLREEVAQTIVSGYSMCSTLKPLISSGEKSPNWISWMVRSGALECLKIRFAIFAVSNAR